MPERRGSAMYDPARDIFTASDDAPVESKDRVSPSGSKRKRSTSPDGSSEVPQRHTTSETRTGNDQEVTKDALSSPKRVRSAIDGPSLGSAPVPVTAAALSQVPRVKKAPNAQARDAPRRPERSPVGRRRSRSPVRQSLEASRATRRRTPPRRRSPSPKPIRRSPTPPARSPPRQRKRPGGSARISAAEAEAVERRRRDREEESNNKAQAEAAARGVHDVVRQHYNAVPQRGREWRKTGSLIKGLRSLNNWIKSAIIQKFSPDENYTPGARERGSNYENHDKGLLILDIGCGKGGDLQKWQAAPQRVELYVALDPADVSIEQARERYGQMQKGGRGGYRDRNTNALFHAEFDVKDCFGEWIGDVPIVREVGIDGSVGPDGSGHASRFGGGGFDVVSMMFCMHYAFESEAKARGMLRNVSGALKKGGRFLGVIPNSDILTTRVNEHNAKHGKAAGGDSDDEWDPEKTLDASAEATAEPPVAGSHEPLEWGNGIYRVKFPGRVPTDGVFRPPFGWKYFYFLEEAVEEIPEYVVPWEAFRAMAVEYDLELQYRRPFGEVWDAEKDDPILGPLSERMGVRERGGGRLLVSDEEFEAAGFYHAFCFYKT